MTKAKDVVCAYGVEGVEAIYDALNNLEHQTIYLVVCIKSMVYFIQWKDGLETIEDHYGHKDLF